MQHAKVYINNIHMDNMAVVSIARYLFLIYCIWNDMDLMLFSHFSLFSLFPLMSTPHSIFMLLH